MAIQKDFHDPNRFVSRKVCPHCGKVAEVRGEFKQLFDWQNGTMIQNAFPDMSADEREMLMTGIHPKCWEDMFKDIDEED